MVTVSAFKDRKKKIICKALNKVMIKTKILNIYLGQWQVAMSFRQSANEARLLPSIAFSELE